MKIYKILLGYICVAMLIISCDVEDGQDLNGPSTESISSDLSRGELRDAMFGVFADMRTQLGTQIDAQAVAGREYWRFQSSDPRWTADLLTGTLDNNTFYTTNPYAARYASIKNVNLILEGLENSTETFTDEEKAGIRGVLNTIKAHELLMVLNLQFLNGIRIDVADEENLGPFVSYEQALTDIFTMLTDAATDLSNSGDSLPFGIPSGFNDLSTEGDGGVSGFIAFTNALAARVEAYRGNYPSVLELLDDSFMEMSGGNLSKGVYFTFALTGADVPNPLFFAKNSTGANARIAHPTFIDDAEAGDTRLNKVVFREAENSAGVVEPNPLTQSNLTGTHDVFIYESNTSPVAIIRNEELILLAAEANHITNPTAAVDAINIIRNAAGLGDYAGGTSQAELVTEILRQRRYSLYAEGGHRWIDLRRFDRLDELRPLDRDGDDIFEQFPTPENENR
ncbi:RagB/SusD family nutrient uptake outer membrane protein [Aquimarina algicola]|uniref:RagB/SusD family nutrient uptake outer membrane protein n=1 Tax=Aquimarina algicola TaxID=2589995 RepID=A0A504JEN9_9FLAO|nr:RagB/SusD family nutrient uptake outer membrane protein [Aquimarina algicola]TPN86178.1 RagB/SusD family nutrient uptake outer membrane protein [Aquimarina algicola]